MSAKIARVRVEIIWVLVGIICAALLAFASVRRYQHAHVLQLHLDELFHPSTDIVEHTKIEGGGAIVHEEAELAVRSRAQFASLLGVTDSTARRIKLESEKWKPLLLRKCTEDMLPYYAPCLTKVISNLEYGEELVYPDFEASLPGFFTAQDAMQWLMSNYGPDKQGQTSANKRVVVDERQGRLVFSGLRGQNLVFRNVTYFDGILPSTWVADSSHCLGHMTSTDSLRQGGAEQAQVKGIHGVEEAEAEEAALYITPDSERYQHWLDHTTKPLMQSAHLITDKTRILMGGLLQGKQPIVRTMWHWLPHINSSNLNGSSRNLRVRRMIVSCRVPYVHPYLFFRLQEMVVGPESPRVPLSERKVVVWYSRSSSDSSRQNQGREVVNEKEVLASIRELLQQRGLGERLELHPPARAPANPLEYVRYLNSNTAAFLGPHGGGLCNFKWLATGTLVLELMPREWINTPLYEEAIGHGLNYWVDLRDSRDRLHNMEANVTNIINLLKAELGKEPARGPIIRYRYDWPGALEDSMGSATGDDPPSPYFSSLKNKCCNTNAASSEGIYVLPQPQLH